MTYSPARDSPSLSLLLLSVIALLVVYCCVGAIVNYRKLCHFKGPPFAALSRLWLWRQSLSARMVDSQLDALQKYGSPARIGPNLLVTNDAELLRHLSAPRSRWTRSGWYDGVKFDPRQNNVFSERDERRHADLRTKMIGGYSGKEIDTLEDDIDGNILALLSLIRRDYSDKAMDFSSVATYFTLDVIGTIAFGSAFGFLKENKDLYDYEKSLSASLPLIEWILNHQSFRWIMQTRLVSALLAPKSADSIGQGRLINMAQKAVAERYSPDAKPKRDMLGWFLHRGLTQQEAEVESHQQILAGSGTVGNTFRNTFLHLLANPTAYNRLRSEIDSTDLSKPIIQHNEALKLPYLQAVLMEGLRIFPPVVGLMSKLAPYPDGDTIDGKFYPSGTEVSLCMLGVTRNKKIFGSDADVFRPERWLEADEATRARYQRTTEVVFGSGRYVCLGKSIAMMELGKVFVELLRNFDWAIVNPLKGVSTKTWGTHVQSGMYFRAWPRQEEEHRHI